MAGLGVGGWLGGRLADRLSGRLLLYGGMQAGIGLCAAGIPVALAALRRWAPRVALLAPESLLLPSVTRFVVSFAILFVPCLLMGATLPALVRFCAELRQVMGGRIGLLYGLNTLGAAAGCFAAGALIYASNPPAFLSPLAMTALTVLVPTVLMGVAFPLLCAAYTQSVATAGRSVGVIYAFNTLGAIVGSLIPVFLLIPRLGIQPSIFLMAFTYAASGALLWLAAAPLRNLLGPAGVTTLAPLAVVLFVVAVPADLCRRVLLSTTVTLGSHNEILFYREGRTGTASVVRDRISGIKKLYINSVGEVPTSYDGMACFKLMGGLGPLLHPKPDEVLMICFGGGIAAGTAARFPEVESLEVVDLESSVVEAAHLLEDENNRLLDNPKVKVIIDDGRNYILTSQKKWPVIVSDATHPKSSDSWVLYTREFYRTVKEHLADDAVFVQWLPIHGLSPTEYRIVVRTMQSVFPHTSIWLSHGVNETGVHVGYTLLAATPERLAIDAAAWQRRLSAPAVARDLRPWGLDSAVGWWETFVCAEDALRQWVGEGPVNTDDLPFTQYRTRYSRGEECTLATFRPVLESIWPYLTNTGNQAQSAQLKDRLALHARANRLMLAGRTADALALLPEDSKVRRCRQNEAVGLRYTLALAEHHRDNARVLAWLAHTVTSRPGGSDLGLALYNRVLALEPDHAQAHNNLGVALARRGNLARAVEHYRRALEAEPRYAKAHNNLAVALMQRGELERAVDHLRQALRIEPDYAEAHDNLGIALAARGRYEDAIAHHRRALAISPDVAETHSNLAMALARHGRLAEAISGFERALEIAPDSAKNHFNLGIALAGDGELDRASEHFRQALRIRPDYEAAQSALARALQEQAQRSGAPSAHSPLGGDALPAP